MTHPWDEDPPVGPCYCVECGKPVEDDRRVYGWPTCYACLPPPAPLPICSPKPKEKGKTDE